MRWMIALGLSLLFLGVGLLLWYDQSKGPDFLETCGPIYGTSECRAALSDSEGDIDAAYHRLRGLDDGR